MIETQTFVNELPLDECYLIDTYIDYATDEILKDETGGLLLDEHGTILFNETSP